ncbi:MAG: outer membrane lipoprotein carrier protein LolA, partial [Amphiplicatus sp.]
MDFALLSVLTLACADPALALSPPPMAAPAVLVAAVQTEAAIPAKASPEIVDAAPAVLLPKQAEAPLAFADLSDEEVVERVLTALESVTTLEGDFTQVAPSGAVSTGKFHLRRPGLLRFEYDPPTPLLIIANGGLVYVRDEALETTDSY